MSRIPKLPLVKKENNAAIGSSRYGGNRAAVNALSDVDKRKLITSHTRPLRNGNPAAVQNQLEQNNPPTQKVNIQPLKRPGLTTLNGPGAKQPKIDTRTNKVAPKIPPYDYKARFNDLVEKHKALKNDFVNLKETHEEIADDYEKVKESLQTYSSENKTLCEKLENALSNLKMKTTDYEKVLAECELEKRENDELKRKTEILGEVSENLRKKSVEYDTLFSEQVDLKRRFEGLKEEAEALRVLSDLLKKTAIDHDRLQIEHKTVLKEVEKFKKDNEALQNFLASMYQEQKDLRNALQDLKGNIRVYCRVRPPLESESHRPLFNLNVLDSCSIEVEKVELNSAVHSSRKGKQQQQFTFDGIFTPHTTQEDVFSEVSPMIQSALDGYNVCIFAYGQTGSGKTFTMEGGCAKENYGIIPRAFNMIFDSIEDLKRMGWILTIKASFLEIYNETIYDLLTSSKDQEMHEIKMVNSKGSDVYVSNLKEEDVKSSYDFIRLMIFAQKNRQTAATLNNERSSRSHSVTQVKIFAINEKRKEKFISHLNLVDLAGSESGKTTQRMDETKHINRSLSELSKVILALQTNQQHIPYRNSKLTHLLMPSLGGNSKTLMLVNISQFDECYNETLNSLRFATKVNSCRTVKAKKNITMVDAF